MRCVMLLSIQYQWTAHLVYKASQLESGIPKNHLLKSVLRFLGGKDHFEKLKVNQNKYQKDLGLNLICIWYQISGNTFILIWRRLGVKPWFLDYSVDKRQKVRTKYSEWLDRHMGKGGNWYHGHHTLHISQLLSYTKNVRTDKQNRM